MLPDTHAPTRARTATGRAAELVYARRESLVAAILAELPGGDRSRRESAHDVELDLDALEAALRIGDPDVFAQHCAWRARVLRARQLGVEGAREGLEAARRALHALDPTTSLEIDAILAAGSDALSSAPGARAGDLPALEGAAATLVDALLKGDRGAVEDILRRARESGATPARIADEIVQPAMRAIGARWESNEVTVADEHVASAILQSALARSNATTAASPAGKRIALACVEGNLHAMGLRVVADALEAAGWQVDFLGADVPTRDLVEKLRARPVAVVGLSLALPAQFPAARRAVEALHRELGARCPRIALGGNPLIARSDLAEYAGVDMIFASAEQAVASLR